MLKGRDFWRFCFRLGLVEAIRGIDYFRYYEYPRVYQFGSWLPGSKVLDLGCGKGIFPLICSRHHPEVEYWTVDIEPTAIGWQKKMQQRLGGLAALHPQLGDSTKLEFSDNTFDQLLNIGSIEHIPGQGDIRTAAEMGRVCKPGGRLIFSIPYSWQGGEQATADHWQGFERRYDDTMLAERIIQPSGCDLTAIAYFGESGFSFASCWYKLPFVCRLPLRHIAPIMSQRFIHEIPAENRKTACGVQFVLTKPTQSK